MLGWVLWVQNEKCSTQPNSNGSKLNGTKFLFFSSRAQKFGLGWIGPGWALGLGGFVYRPSYHFLKHFDSILLGQICSLHFALFDSIR